MKNLSLILILIFFISPAFSSDNIVWSPTGSACQLIDAHGNHWNAKVGFTTDGNGDIFTLGDVASTDNVLGQNPSGNRTLIDNSSRRWSASVLYTTDGNGNVIPVPAGGGVSSVSGTAPVVSSGGSTPAISMSKATSAVDGYLFHTDWETFNSKQDSGSYLTALTGDVAASGPGSALATIQPLAVTNAKIANATIDLSSKVTGLLPNANVASIPAPQTKYIDFNLGSDVACPATPCGDGSSMRPWHTLNHAFSSVTDESVNKPYAFIISGGNNDPDTGTINAKPNIALYAPYQIQISQPFVVGPDDVPGIGNDVLNYTNITFLFAFSFVKNDASENTIFAVSTEFNGGPTIKQSGSGWMFIDWLNVTTNGADFKLGDTGAIFFSPYFNGTTTFEDATASAYYQFMGGYLGGPLSITGAPFVYSSGLMIDVPFGATWTNVHSANGDPTVQFDSAGLPPSVTGAYSSVFTSFSQYVGYSPASSSQWSTVPTTVKSALDSARVLSQSVSGSQPGCSSSNRGLQWLVQGGSGVADIFQVCQKNSSDAYVWTTH